MVVTEYEFIGKEKKSFFVVIRLRRLKTRESGSMKHELGERKNMGYHVENAIVTNAKFMQPYRN